jgi:hypothetical protein
MMAGGTTSSRKTIFSLTLFLSLERFGMNAMLGSSLTNKHPLKLLLRELKPRLVCRLGQVQAFEQHHAERVIPC